MPDPNPEANKQAVPAFDEAGLDHKDSHGAWTLPGERHGEHGPLTADGADGFTAFVGPFRLGGGTSVEHRDVIQPIPPIQVDAANQNGMF